MKKISFICCLFVLLTAFTCDNESIDPEILNQEFENNDNNTGNNNGNNNGNSNGNNNGNNSLLGDWELIDFNADVTTESEVQGMVFESNFIAEAISSNYILTFEASDYTVSGDYELALSTTVNGETTTSTDSYTNVNGQGTYTTEGNIMTIDGSFVVFEFDGMPQSAVQDETEAEFEISDDGQTLTFTQDEVQVQNEQGIMATIHVIGTSVWQKIN